MMMSALRPIAASIVSDERSARFGTRIATIAPRSRGCRPASEEAVPPNVFLSYSHQDLEWLARVLVVLKPLEELALVRLWCDQRIPPGTTWIDQLDDAADRADIGLLLISPAFVASDFIRRSELPKLLVRWSESNRRVPRLIPLFVRTVSDAVLRFRFETPSGPQVVDLGGLQGLNDPRRSLASMTEGEVDEALAKIVDAIKPAFERQRNGSSDAGLSAILPGTWRLSGQGINPPHHYRITRGAIDPGRGRFEASRESADWKATGRWAIQDTLSVEFVGDRGSGFVLRLTFRSVTQNRLIGTSSAGDELELNRLA